MKGLSIRNRMLALMLIIISVVCCFAIPVDAAQTYKVRRVAGNDRYGTSQAVASAFAKEVGKTKFPAVVIATGSNFPDALSGTYFAIAMNAPMLLVNPKNTASALSYIKNNIDPNEGRVYILGGKSALPKSIDQELKNYANVKRIYGVTRYDTNLELLSQTVSKGSDLLICSGKSPYDALGAAATGKPILLVDGALTSAQRRFIKKTMTSNSEIYIIGGPAAVPDKVANQLMDLGFMFSRLYGNNRYDTSVELAKFFFPKSTEALLSSGDSSFDSLSGAVLANAKNCPLLLSSNTANFQAARNYIVKKRIPKVTILGGPKACATLASGMQKDGTLYSGFFDIGNSTYYSDSKYILARKSIFKADGNRYHANSVGAITKNTSFKFDGASYRADSNGRLTVTQKVIYLTFDDGPSGNTKQILNTLRKHGVKATFFVVPSPTNTRLRLISRMSYQGHTIGNHTVDHDWYNYTSPTLYWNSVAEAGKAIKTWTGKSTKYIRFVGGSNNTQSKYYSKGIMTTLTQQAAQKGYIYFDWNVEANDAGSSGTTDSKQIAQNIINGISGKDSAMVLCHERNSGTAAALEEVIIWGKNHGYKFLPIDDSAPTFHLKVNN